MIHCSQLFNVSQYVHHPKMKIGSSISVNTFGIHDSDYIDSASLMNALQKTMAELVKTQPGIKPEMPLRIESEDNLPTWLMKAWVFDGFHIIAVSKHRQGSSKGDIETRLEFVPISM